MTTNVKQLSLKEKLARGKTVIGTWCELPSPHSINVLAKAGLDFVVIDMEHGVMDFKTVSEMVMAAQADGCAPLIRVASVTNQNVLLASETEPAGILAPHISSENK